MAPSEAFGCWDLQGSSLRSQTNFFGEHLIKGPFLWMPGAPAYPECASTFLPKSWSAGSPSKSLLWAVWAGIQPLLQSLGKDESSFAYFMPCSSLACQDSRGTWLLHRGLGIMTFLLLCAAGEEQIGGREIGFIWLFQRCCWLYWSVPSPAGGSGVDFPK